jgi:hypothetical protein
MSNRNAFRFSGLAAQLFLISVALVKARMDRVPAFLVQKMRKDFDDFRGVRVSGRRDAQSKENSFPAHAANLTSRRRELNANDADTRIGAWEVPIRRTDRERPESFFNHTSHSSRCGPGRSEERRAVVDLLSGNSEPR